MPCKSRFISLTKLHSKQDVSAAIHRALIEVFTLHEAGLEPMVQNAVGDDRGVEAMSGTKIVQGGDGTVKVEYASEELRGEVIAALTTLPEEEAAMSEVEIAADADGDSTSDAEAQMEEQENAEEIREQDVFEPEEQTSIQKTPNPPPNTWLASSNAIPVDQWVNTTFHSPALKFAVSTTLASFPQPSSPELPLPNPPSHFPIH